MNLRIQIVGTPTSLERSVRWRRTPRQGDWVQPSKVFCSFLVERVDFDPSGRATVLMKSALSPTEIDLLKKEGWN